MTETHNAEIIHENKLPGLEFWAKCSCQTEGRFGSKDQAMWFLTKHLRSNSVDPKQIAYKEEPENGGVTQGRQAGPGGEKVQSGHAAEGVRGGSEGQKQAPSAGHREGPGERVKK